MAFIKTTLSLIWRHPAGTLVAFFCFTVAATASPTHGAESVNGIAAVVNNDVITYSEVRDLVGPRERLLRSQYTGEELNKKIIELRKSALQDLIDRQLIIQAFEKEKFEIPQYFVDERVAQVIRDSFGGDRNAFIKTMESQKFSMSKFKSMEREKIIVQAMRREEREDQPARPAGQGGGILPPASRPLREQGAGEIAHDHDPRETRCGRTRSAKSDGR